MRSADVMQERGSPALRVAIAVEDLLQRAVLAVLSRVGGWRVAVLPFVGHGSPDRVHVRARVVVGRAVQETPVSAPPAAGAAARRGAWRTLGRSLARFLTVELPGAQVTAHLPAGAMDLTCDREGYVDAVVERAGLAPGWHDVRLTARWRGRSGAAVARVLVVAPDVRSMVVSDVDDTVIETGLTKGLAFLRLTLLTDVDDRTPLPGAAALYRALAAEPSGPGGRGGPGGPSAAGVSGAGGPEMEAAPDGPKAADVAGAPGLPGGTSAAGGTAVPGGTAAPGGAGGPGAASGGPGAPVFYLSTSPWNLHDLLLRFIALRQFPAGPLLLTDWGPGRGALFRIPSERHKLTFLRQLLADHPQASVMLVGDTGQVDPEIYATLASEAPERVTAVYLRRTAGIPAARADEVARLAGTVSDAGVPMLVVEDSVQIAEHAYGIGLLDRFAVDDVRSASAG